MMNQKIWDLKDSNSVRQNERKLYNIQLNVQIATAAIAKKADMALEADHSSKLIDCKALIIHLAKDFLCHI